MEIWPVLKEVRSAYVLGTLPSKTFGKVSDNTMDLLKNVLERYGSLSSWKLSSLSHKEFSWKKARKGLEAAEDGDVALSLEAMKVDATRELLNRKSAMAWGGGIIINTEEKRKFFQGFKYETLTSNPENRELIGKFVSKKENNTLEAYIKDEDKAWKEDLDGETRVYLVKDKSGNIALFFSVKCGLLVGENLEEKLSEEDQDFVNTIIDLIKEKDEMGKRNMYDLGISVYGNEVDRLFEIAEHRFETKTESIEIGQSQNTINVPTCMSAIELRHLCKNENYVMPAEVNIPLGFGIFWEIIVPIIIEITKQVGCKYVYLFAADKTEEQSEFKMKKLISHYKNNFKFSECDEGMKFVKPEYDNHCYGLIQSVSNLESNREAIWHEFSDV